MSRDTNIKITELELSADASTLWDTKGGKLLRALGSQPMPPCVDRGDGSPCEFFRRCASELQACRAFYAYTRELDDKKEYGKWRTMERHPNKNLYAKTYNESNDRKLITAKTPQKP